MKIRITVNGETLTATLAVNATARHFMSLLPLTLVMEDFAGKEKIANPPEELVTNGAPEGSVGNAGDLMLYAPWGNLAFFYQDHGYARGLIPIAELEDAHAFRPGSEPVNVRYELIPACA